ncbi:low temperature requirement protein A [Verrucosispora sp. WMMD703]|uniref:Membrane protein n=1 Tax=Micromonospora sediminimaris TaxID=547162 RepID=A0A9W5XM27_9ACTN|nr:MULTISPECIES: low temperature requirement protein A [Micromonospora]WFE45923.1 low temperature requirement protein A [Verrucosispora sp. WMMD1129]GIJ35672.1 membrane protein [Micromonospora sediminimaris]SFD76097.1 Low temperature requirement protein LtrA [Micromonospora sediminimaris]
MSSGLPARLLRRREVSRRPSFLELFFDLAFILALNRLSRALEDDLGVGGAYRTALLLAAIWWVWFVTAWSTDWFEPRTPLISGLLLWVMFGGMLMAAAAPTAYAGHALVFAGAYVAIHLGRAALLLPALRGHPLQLRTLRVAIWFAVSGVLWLAGAFVGPAQVLLWTAAVVLDYSMARLRWPTPRLGRSSWENLQIIGEHLSERYQQIFIIALGELILTAGITFSQSGFDLGRSAAFALMFVNAVSLGRLYLVPGGMRLGTAIEAMGPPGSRLGLLAGYLHLVMIAGVLATGVGSRLMIMEPFSHELAAVVTMAAGPTLFLTGWILLALAVHGKFSWQRLIGMVAILIAAVAGHELSLLVNSAIITGLLILIAHGDTLANRVRRHRQS